MKFLKFATFKILFTLSFFTTLAQTGSISGYIAEKKNKEVAIGATVKIEGTAKGANTDLNGFYEIKGLAAGNYSLVVSYVGFTTQKLENIKVEADKITTINVQVEEDTKTLSEVVVTTQKLTTTEVAVIDETRKAPTIAVGISGHQIAKTMDRDASAVVRRVSGVSIFDDRFIVVRGLNERYNSVILNDIITPSTEVDVKSFSFDLIPSNAIDRMLVYKSASADLPGDMAGGAIKIFTKTVPEKNSLTFNATLGYRSTTSGKSAQTYTGSKTDALGFDNGQRALPQDFPGRNTIINNASLPTVIDRFKNLNSYYSVNNQVINPDLRASLNFSHKWFIGDRQLTNISFVNYSNTHQLNSITQNRYNFDAKVIDTFADRSNVNQIRLGAMSNWALILNSNHKIEWRNMFNQLAVKETVIRNGNNFENNLESSNAAFRWEQRSIATSHLSGNHKFGEKSLFKWAGGLGYTLRQEPDFRRFTATRATGSSEPFIINLQQFESPTLQQAARFYSDMDEILVSGRLDYELALGQNANIKNDEGKRLSIGTYTEIKDRGFQARWFGIVNPNRMNNEFLAVSNTQFFDASNLATNKFYYTEGSNFDDRYFAQNYLNAGYLKINWPFTEKFSANAGVRIEHNQQMLQSRERGSGTKIDVKNIVTSPLPSANLTYNLSEKQILRAGFGMTINRPEFRELAPFTYYDFNFDVARIGNKNIKNATITNFDLRYDLYPTKSELITIGAFYKSFVNPIEQAVFYNGSTVAFTVENAKSAFTTGVELEVRKNLTGIFKDRLTASTNLTFINSNVRVSGVDNANRYLQGQSPFLINAGLFYNDQDHGWSGSILYNVIGKRIFVIGDNVLSANVFEMPRNVVDISVSKSLNKRLEFKLGIQDLLNQPFKLVQDTDRNNKITDADGTYQSFRRGTVSSLSIVYKLK